MHFRRNSEINAQDWSNRFDDIKVPINPREYGYKDSKKVSNKKMKNKLKIKLKYPTYRQGLRNIFNNFS